MKIKNPIRTLESLYQHLQWAIEVEHFTIPPYLCALYSIPENSSNQQSAKIILSVVMEEMLHMIQVANIMNAVNCQPVVNQPGFIPDYPRPMPHSANDLLVSLEYFSVSAIKTFMAIEEPEKKGAPEDADHYHTIGELYDAIEEGLRWLDEHHPGGIFHGDPGDQIQPHQYYGGGGELKVVDSLQLALEAIHEIKEQGEGYVDDGSIWDGDRFHFNQPAEPAHFFRFNEILCQQYYQQGDTRKTGPRGAPFVVHWNEVYKMTMNPKVKNYPEGSEERNLMEAFNFTYTKLLDHLQKAFTGHHGFLEQAVGLMYQLKYQAVALMQIPNPQGEGMLGPSFEFSYAYFRELETN